MNDDCENETDGFAEGSESEVNAAACSRYLVEQSVHLVGELRMELSPICQQESPPNATDSLSMGVNTTHAALFKALLSMTA